MARTMETTNQSITLDIEDESQDYVGHMIIHEDPDSPVTPRANTPPPTDALSDTSDSAYDADTLCDSPRSTDTTFDLNDDSEIGEASAVATLQCHEQVDYSDMPPLEETEKDKEDSTDENALGDGSSESNEPHGIRRNVDENDLPLLHGLPTSNPNESNSIQNYDESAFLFSPGYKPLSKPNEESEDEQ